jgi:hypothetical protein
MSKLTPAKRDELVKHLEDAFNIIDGMASTETTAPEADNPPEYMALYNSYNSSQSRNLWWWLTNVKTLARRLPVGIDKAAVKENLTDAITELARDFEDEHGEEGMSYIDWKCAISTAYDRIADGDY